MATSTSTNNRPGVSSAASLRPASSAASLRPSQRAPPPRARSAAAKRNSSSALDELSARLFEARCDDLDLIPTEERLKRFQQIIAAGSRRLDMAPVAYG